MARNLIADGRATERGARYLIDAMTDHFPDAAVAGFADLIDRLTNDPKDRHVLAAAITCGARQIVTNNLRDFPEASLAPFGIHARSPDAFLSELFLAAPRVMAGVIEQQAADLQHPAMSVDQITNTLAKQAPEFAALLRAWLDLE